jgi:hypothetical protein
MDPGHVRDTKNVSTIWGVKKRDKRGGLERENIGLKNASLFTTEY